MAHDWRVFARQVGRPTPDSPHQASPAGTGEGLRVRAPSSGWNDPNRYGMQRGGEGAFLETAWDSPRRSEGSRYNLR